MTFRTRRLLFATLTVFAVALVVLVHDTYGLSLRNAAFVDGWIMVTAIVFLSLFNLRKAVSVAPLFDAWWWLQAHVYVGLFAAALSILHTGGRLPTGVFEVCLWSVFVLVAATGVVGTVLSRRIPPRLRQRPLPLVRLTQAKIAAGLSEFGDRRQSNERVLFERIPQHRAMLMNRAEELALEAAQVAGASTIADFHTTRLAPYFQRPRNMLSHLMQSNRGVHQLIEDLRPLERYLEERGLEILAEIEELVHMKANLDYQYAHFLMLRGWLFIHVPLAFAMWVLIALHVIFVYAFSSGAP